MSCKGSDSERANYITPSKIRLFRGGVTRQEPIQVQVYLGAAAESDLNTVLLHKQSPSMAQLSIKVVNTINWLSGLLLQRRAYSFPPR